MEQTTLKIDGMSCGGCVHRVSNVLKSLPGVEVDEVIVGRATVMLDPAVASPDQVIRALAAVGYRARQE
ncbi:MAG: heavy-metal-associated domain-containing protein [Acidobacteria bacterium]|nr:heavy-metal-associated domain-containing protein [Acidobacteriota bacterium]